MGFARIERQVARLRTMSGKRHFDAKVPAEVAGGCQQFCGRKILSQSQGSRDLSSLVCRNGLVEGEDVREDYGVRQAMRQRSRVPSG